MNIPPVLLLCIGATFALAYAMIIIFGWAKTRKNRRVYQKAEAISILPVLRFDKTIKDSPSSVECVSIENNIFTDPKGEMLNPEDFKILVALGNSPENQNIKNGDILFLSKGTNKIEYVFTVPDLRKYR